MSRLKIGELTVEKLPVIILDHPVLCGIRGRREAGSTESWDSRFSLGSRRRSITMPGR